MIYMVHERHTMIGMEVARRESTTHRQNNTRYYVYGTYKYVYREIPANRQQRRTGNRATEARTYDQVQSLSQHILSLTHTHTHRGRHSSTARPQNLARLKLKLKSKVRDSPTYVLSKALLPPSDIAPDPPQAAERWKMPNDRYHRDLNHQVASSSEGATELMLSDPWQ